MPKQRGNRRAGGRGGNGTRGGASTKGGRGGSGKRLGANPFALLATADDPAPQPSFQFSPSVLTAGAAASSSLSSSGSPGFGAGAGAGVGAGAGTITSSTFQEMARAMATATGARVPSASVADLSDVGAMPGLAAAPGSSPGQAGSPFAPASFSVGGAGAASGLSSMAGAFASATPDVAQRDAGAQPWDFGDLAAKFSQEKAKVDQEANQKLWEAAKTDARNGVLKAKAKVNAREESRLSKRVKGRRKRMAERARGVAAKVRERVVRNSRKDRARRRFRDLY